MNIGRFETDKIYNEDCYKAIKDIPDKSIDCIYTDIPYLIDDRGGHTGELGERLKKKSEELKDFSSGINYEILSEYVRVMKKVNCFIWCSKMQIFDIMKYFLETIDKTIYFEILVWNKTNPTPSINGNWLPDIEYCLYFRESGVKLNTNYEYKSKWYTHCANVRDKDKFEHPTIKPLPLVERHLKHTTQEGDLVLDTFMGSGTTAVACKNTGRHYIGFEIEKKWYDIANDRLNNIDANGQISLFTM